MKAILRKHGVEVTAPAAPAAAGTVHVLYARASEGVHDVTVEGTLQDVAVRLMTAEPGRQLADLSDLYGRPTLWMAASVSAIKHGFGHVDHSTMAEHARRAAAAAARRHARACATIDPRLDGALWTGVKERAARAGYWHGPARAWPGSQHSRAEAVTLPAEPLPQLDLCRLPAGKDAVKLRWEHGRYVIA